jgi:hypothetical protein
MDDPEWEEEDTGMEESIEGRDNISNDEDDEAEVLADCDRRRLLSQLPQGIKGNGAVEQAAADVYLEGLVKGQGLATPVELAHHSVIMVPHSLASFPLHWSILFIYILSHTKQMCKGEVHKSINNQNWDLYAMMVCNTNKLINNCMMTLCGPSYQVKGDGQDALGTCSSCSQLTWAIMISYCKLPSMAHMVCVAQHRQTLRSIDDPRR